jgi:tetratricopeptide (TPR) repeat protein
LAEDEPAQSYDSKLEMAVEKYSEQNFGDAVALLTELEVSQPDRKEAHLWMGKAQMRLSNWSAARAAFKSYVQLSSNDAIGFQQLANACERDGKPDLALLYIRKANELDPANEEIRKSVVRLEALPRDAESLSDAQAQPVPTNITPSSLPAGGEVAANKKGSFWRTGLVGLTKVRSVWWGQVIAVIIFGLWSFNGAIQLGKTAKKMSMPAAAVMPGSVFGTAVLYIVFWGIPQETIGWTMLALMPLFAASFTASSSK